MKWLPERLLPETLEAYEAAAALAAGSAGEAPYAHMSSLHVLLGLVQQDGSSAAVWLAERGIDLQRFREVLQRAIELHPGGADTDFFKLVVEVERQRPIESIRTVDLLEELRYGACDCAAGQFLVSAGLSSQPGPA